MGNPKYNNDDWDFIYFIASEDRINDKVFIKVGHTTNWDERRDAHTKTKNGVEVPQTVLAVVRGAKSCEDHFKSDFRKKGWKVNGIRESEIYYPKEGLLNYIRWLRDRHYVWVPGDVYHNTPYDLPMLDFSFWINEDCASKPRPRSKRGLMTGIGGLLEKLGLSERNVGADDYYTHESVVEAARKVMGGIDLDPATHVVANTVVKAKTIYTMEDDGLIQDWFGRIWINPPFKKAKPWIDKLRLEWRRKSFDQLCLFLPTRKLSTKYMRPLIREAPCWNILTGRPPCWGKLADGKTPMVGFVVFYIGDNVRGFRKVFAKLGENVKAVK